MQACFRDCFRDWIYHHLKGKWHWRQKDAIAFFDTGALRVGINQGFYLHKRYMHGHACEFDNSAILLLYWMT